MIDDSIKYARKRAINLTLTFYDKDRDVAEFLKQHPCKLEYICRLIRKDWDNECQRSEAD